MPRPTIGFVGLGSMGSGMATSILRAGFPLVVTDIRREAGTALVTAGARWAAGAGEVAHLSDVVITMLPTPAHVQQVLSNGLLTALTAGKTWIDMSTSVPAVQAGVRQQLDRAGCRMLDAPVSGMSVGAADGTLQIFVGGPEDVYAEMRPVLEAMGDPERILHVGDHGAGHVVKLLINQLWFSHVVATAEVLAVGEAAGVDVPVLRRSLLASPAASNFLERDVLSILERGDYDDGFAIELACKDLGLSVDLARAHGLPVELTAHVEQIFRRALATYGHRAGEMTPFKLYEELLGREIRMHSERVEASA